MKACVDSALQLGLPEAKLPLSEAAILLATWPKSNSACMAIDAAMADVRAGRTGDIPRELQNVHADSAGMEREQGYLYPHDFPGHWVKQQYLPNELKNRKYYQYGDNKTEQARPAVLGGDQEVEAELSSPFQGGRPIPSVRGKWPKAKGGREARRNAVTDEGGYVPITCAPSSAPVCPLGHLPPRWGGGWRQRKPRKEGIKPMESIRVLVVEDDQDINNLLCTILRDGAMRARRPSPAARVSCGRSGRASTWLLLDLMLPRPHRRAVYSEDPALAHHAHHRPVRQGGGWRTR